MIALRRLAAAAVLAVLGSAPAVLIGSGPALACGPDTDCMVGSRSYRIALPEGPGPHGAIVYMHGWGGTSRDVMGDPNLRRIARELNVALVAPASDGRGWQLRNSPGGIASDDAELAFFDALVEDLGRSGIDRTRLMAAGFSVGGMAVWTLACHEPKQFAAYVSVAGTFWAPMPTDCVGDPVDLLHIHGETDRTVPFTGRSVGGGRQGRVADAIALFTAAGHYGAPEPMASLGGDERLSCTDETAPDGHRLVLCRHPGDHSIDVRWIAAGWQLFMTRS